MESSMYSVQELARIAGVSVRTLHYYDEIGILEPARRTEAGYRCYGHDELLLLQQIMFYRELDVSLAEIRDIIHDPRFDLLRALERHQAALRARAARTSRLIGTVRKTMETLRGERKMLTDRELYEGFTPEQIEHFYEADASRYRGLAEMYVADHRFTAYYDGFAPGLAEFLAQAIRHDAGARLE
ncbi:MAG: MerR family transcriptional regulator [Spirochaetota bacterium]